MNGQKNLEEHWDKIYKHQQNDFRASSLNKLISRLVEPGEVLDIGCGTGGLSLELLNKGLSVTSQDISTEMVTRCKEIFSRAGKNPDKVRVAGVEELEEKDFFDNVIALDVIEHIEDDLFAVKQMHKVLKPGGKLILSVPALSFLYGPKDEAVGHFRRYNKKDLIKVISEAGFKIEKIRFWNFFGVLPVWLVTKVLKKKLSEDFRYKSDSGKAGFLNGFLKTWFKYIENPIPLPIGLTLIISARK